MLILISPAKTFASKSKKLSLPIEATEPLFLSDAGLIANSVLQLGREHLQDLLHISPKLGDRSWADWLAWVDGAAKKLPALQYYSGMVFKRLDSATLTPEAWQRGEGQLLIASFVYGLLSPSNLIAPYRMEGGVDLSLPHAESVFAFWRDKLTPYIIDRARQQGGRLCYLASEEMKSLFHWEEVEQAVKIFTPTFLVLQADGSLKQTTIYTKMARGEMLRAMLQEGLSEPDALQGLCPAGFTYARDLSGTHNWVYILS